jgi:hypothetical protein
MADTKATQSEASRTRLHTTAFGLAKRYCQGPKNEVEGLLMSDDAQHSPPLPAPPPITHLGHD